MVRTSDPESVKSDKFALFLGCTIPYKLPHLEAATRFVIDKLKLKLTDLPFGCCPDPNGIHSYSENTWYALAAHNLALAEEQGLNIITLCNGCYETLHYVNHKLKNDPKKLKEINNHLKEVSQEYKASNNVLHMHEFLHENIGYETLEKLVIYPLENLKISVHYGCHSLRPRSIGQPENAETPQWLWDFVETVLHAEPVHYMDETLCCGAGIREMNQNSSFKLIEHKIHQIESRGANAIIVPCPTCMLQFDGSQKLLLRGELPKIHGTPVFYMTELLAIAMGADQNSIGLKYHLMKPDKDLLKTPNVSQLESLNLSNSNPNP